MKERSRIKLDSEKREEMLDLIKAYFKEERGEELGNLASGILLDFIIERLAPEFYNQGVMDSYKYLDERIEEVQTLLI